MRIVAISDTHRQHRQVKVPDGDILIHAGDIGTENNSAVVLSDFNAWIKYLPHKYKICCPGNHDRYIEHHAEQARKILTAATLLIDQEITIDGIKFYASPWQPNFFNWSYNLPRGDRLKKVWSAIPADTQVLITHGPPFGILDRCADGSVGCADLANRVKELNLKVHIFGHLHQSFGTQRVGDTLFVNASLCDDSLNLINSPIIIEI